MNDCANFKYENKQEMSGVSCHPCISSKVELLSPAGDMDCLKAAIAAGADAIYLGGDRFGARAFAGNFNREELLEALKLAHFWGKKIFLTVNTLTKDSELKELVEWLTPYYEAGLDGLIIQDLGVLETCRNAFPGLLLHASTQMTVTEAETALFLKSLGVSRIVPARELCLEEIVELKEKTGLEMETFIHGALCYGYSGQCLFSSLLGGRSGNRGRCAQPCRLPYEICESGMPEKSGKSQKGKRMEQYPLSLKDLCVLEFLPKLLEAGIDSFKIEGRMKSPEYVAGVTAMYRKYIDLYEQNPKGWKVEKKDLETLSGLYVRSQLSGGYYEKHNGQEMITLDKPGYAGCEDSVLEEIRARYIEPAMTKPVDMEISLRPGSPVFLKVSCEGFEASVIGMEVMTAQKKPLSTADIQKQLSKLGGSSFSPGKFDIVMEQDCFLPVSAMNELRRTALDLLYEKMSAAFKRESSSICAEMSEAREKRDDMARSGDAGQETVFYASALDLSQAAVLAGMEKIARLYVSADAVLLEKNEAFLQAVKGRKEKEGVFECFLVLPPILRSYSETWFNQLMEWADVHQECADGLMAGSLSGLLWAKRKGWTKKISLQHSAYVFNEKTRAFYMEHFAPDTYTLPLELNRAESRALSADNQEICVYGRIPMMQSANCIRKTAGICKVKHTQKSMENGIPKRYFSFSLKDRYQAQFPVLINCRHCMNTIYNSVPLSLHQYVQELLARNPRALRLDFTTESLEETKRVTAFYTEGGGMPPAAYTTGHYKKGVQ